MSSDTMLNEDVTVTGRDSMEYLNSRAGADSNDSIVIKDLRKNYKDFTLNNISFRIPRGSIMGFVGENGAGKTTTLKAMLGLIKTDGGKISVLGADAGALPSVLKEQIGVVFDGSCFHDTLNVYFVNKTMKHLYSNWDEKVFADYIKRFELPDRKILKEYSRGMKMKLAIAVALSHHPRLLILDEATSGLDPMVRDEILDIFLEFIQDENNSILLSSHIITDIEKIADYVTFIHKGNIIFSENKDNLIYQHGVVHCRKEDISGIDRAFVAGIRENSYGAEVLIRNKEAFERRYPKLTAEKTTIEEIMLYISRGKERI